MATTAAAPMAEINVTPLVDVMLVLLIIFMITAPLMSHKVKIELPEANLAETRDPDKTPRAPPITLAVKEDGELYWNDEPRDQSEPCWNRRAVRARRRKKPQPLASTSAATRPPSYRLINEVVKIAQGPGHARQVGFVATRELN